MKEFIEIVNGIRMEARQMAKQLLQDIGNFFEDVRQSLKQEDEIVEQQSADDTIADSWEQIAPMDCVISISEKQEPTDDEIRERAYHLWEQAGRPEGDGSEFWDKAKAELYSPTITVAKNVGR